jgi:hypothetical protein
MNINYPSLAVALYFVIIVIYHGIKGNKEKQNIFLIVCHIWLAASLIGN